MYVVKPLSYSRCAARIVRRASKRNFRLPSCCSVDVVNGGAGLRVNGFSSAEETVNDAWPHCASRDAPAASSSKTTPAFFSAPTSAPNAVATIAKSRNIAPPSVPTPASKEISDSPLSPPVTRPPHHARTRPSMIAMAEPCTWPRVSFAEIQ